MSEFNCPKCRATVRPAASEIGCPACGFGRGQHTHQHQANETTSRPEQPKVEAPPGFKGNYLTEAN